MKALLLILASLIGCFFVIRGFLKNIKEIKTKPAHTSSDKYFNYPVMVLWYLYLFIFCLGLIFNNLIFT